MKHTVGDVARLAHVSVRTLHHYDEIGLLKPSAHSEAGYRLYTTEDLEQLQQVLFYKELGFTLEEIRELMSDPAFDRREALSTQREMIAEQALRLDALLGLIDKTLTSLGGGIQMTKEEMFEVFGDFDPAEHEDEVKERWGNTEAYKVSARRTSKYTKDDWARHKAEADDINAGIVALMDEGVPADDPRAMDAVDRHRLLIDTWFYPCSHEMHVGLAEMYIADPRFKANYEKIRTGMAQYVHDAILACAKRAAG
ncbi:MAG: MerR family transcriptional regulator [Actinobacteria bacterium HGW-Actinobacteria-7]|jgi:DNA-binding transcriptional MerR regulator|nr:MAG: MerR family transcriptional regulator [Actinobacteria bacterium HGW-Actinobacteria-7]